MPAYHFVPCSEVGDLFMAVFSKALGKENTKADF